MKHYKKVLTIAGSDSGGGAGIQADIKTMSACGCYAMSAITSITAQNTVGVSRIHNVPADMVAAQIAAVLEDIGVDAVKLGMLPTEASVVAIAGLLKKYEVTNVVLDPVMVSTSGSRLIDEPAAEAIRTHLFPLATVVTPNIPETEYLTGLKIGSEADFAGAAVAMSQQRVRAVLFKAGHLDGETLTDYLFDNEKLIRHYRYDRPSLHIWHWNILWRRLSSWRKIICTRRFSTAASTGSATVTARCITFINGGRNRPGRY